MEQLFQSDISIIRIFRRLSQKIIPEKLHFSLELSIFAKRVVKLLVVCRHDDCLAPFLRIH